MQTTKVLAALAIMVGLLPMQVQAAAYEFDLLLGSEVRGIGQFSYDDGLQGQVISAAEVQSFNLQLFGTVADTPVLETIGVFTGLDTTLQVALGGDPSPATYFEFDSSKIEFVVMPLGPNRAGRVLGGGVDHGKTEQVRYRIYTPAEAFPILIEHVMEHGSYAYYSQYDSIAFTRLDVPEPGTAAVLTAGLLGLLVLRRWPFRSVVKQPAR